MYLAKSQNSFIRNIEKYLKYSMGCKVSLFLIICVNFYDDFRFAVIYKLFYHLQGLLKEFYYVDYFRDPFLNPNTILITVFGVARLLASMVVQIIFEA